MKLAALGVLAAVLGAGCAFEASDPGAADTRSSEATVSVEARGRTTVTTGSPPGPGSSPEGPSKQSSSGGASGSAGQGLQEGSNPEPSPWFAGAPIEPSGGATAPAGNGAGAVAGAVQASGGTPSGPYRLLGR